MTKLARLARWPGAPTLTVCVALLVGALANAQTDPLPSWHDGVAKQAIVEFVRVTTDKASPRFVAPEAASPCSTRTAPPGSSSRCTRR
jgi:hypothetical protein